MKALIQRVISSSVKINGKTVGKIGPGLNVFIAVTHNDTEKEAEYIAEKTVKMRIFNDENDKINLSLQDVEGEIMVVSQFTLYSNCRKGNRPSFTDSAKPDKANELYEYFINYLRNTLNMKISTGEFGADMIVTIENDGPVTIILDSDIRKKPR